MRSTDPRSSARSILLDGNVTVGGPSENWRQAFPEIIGRSDPMLRVLETVSKVARSDSAVLIQGESGTGKELIAAAIHRLSQRNHKGYVTLNCAAIPESLLESELFGHEKGAFTSADRRRAGRFEEAAGGTLFLDEIGDMPLTLQAKLLRVLQDKRYTPLGGNETKEADVRIVAATNMNLQQAQRSGTFRPDLYYRLNVLPIFLPPLRERTEDIPDLLEHFIEMANRSQGVGQPSYFSDELVRLLCTFQWPGNVRQLQNLVERLVVMKGGGCIVPGDLPRELIEGIDDDRNGALRPSAASYEPSASDRLASLPGRVANDAMASAPREPALHETPVVTAGGQPIRYPQNFGHLPSEGLDLQTFIEGLENDLIRQALERTGNNRNQAAKLLGLNRTTLVERIKKRKLIPLNEPSKEL